MAASLLALLPVSLFLCGLVVMDSFKLVTVRALTLALAGGVAAAALSVILQPLLVRTGVPDAMVGRILAPIVEETVKGAMVVAIIATRRAGFPVDAAIQGFAVGTGFALVENVVYLTALPGAGLLLWVVRGFGTAMLHGTASAIFALLAQRLTARRGVRAPLAYLPGWAAAVVVHVAFNLTMLPPMVQMLITLIAVPLLLVAVFEWSERGTREWVGAGLDLDVELLDLVTSDAFQATRFATYLQELRARFPGPVVADMFCLLRLQLELSAQAKGKLIARAAGLDLQPDADTRLALEELRFLRVSIGRTGLLALEPLSVISDRDHWHRHLLRP